MANKRRNTATLQEAEDVLETETGAEEGVHAPGDSQEAARTNEPADPAKKKSPPWIELFREGQAELSEDEIKRIVHRQVAEDLADDPLADTYNILFLYDDRSIDRSDADRIYRAVESIDPVRPLLLILHSRGGVASAAYFIAKICREYSKGTFEVGVPRQAVCGDADLLWGRPDSYGQPE